MPPSAPSASAALARHVEIEHTTGCWEWVGAITPNGYGQMGYKRKKYSPHRFAYQLFSGPIPQGKEIDHLCRNRRCCNPNHLEAVTRRENIMRSPIAVTAIHSRKTECPRCGSDYTLETRGGITGRRCRPCHYRAMRSAAKKKRELQ